MARISTYPIDTNLVATDKWIGTDANSNRATKNFTLENVANWINSTSSVDSQTLRYTYQAEATNLNRMRGSISFVPVQVGSVPFSTITEWTLSSYSLKSIAKAIPIDISGFYSAPLIDSYVIVTNAKDISEYGIFLWDSAVLKVGTTEFWDIGLTPIVSSGGLEDTKDYLVSLLTYKPASNKTFVFTQAVPGTVWDITHNLDKFPSVSVVNNNNIVINGEVTYIDKDNVQLNFSAGFAGKAYLN